jgi:peptide/nickel transport system substrate-binding protein
VTAQAPEAICELAPTYVSTNLIINREVAPFNDPLVRKAMALALDRQAFVDILSSGKANISGVMLPPPEGVWGMPSDVLKTLPGYSADVASSRAEARKIIAQDHGETGIQREQPTQGRDLHSQHCCLPRSGGDPH